MSIRWSKMANDSASIVKAASDGFNCIELTVDHVMGMNDDQFLLEKNLFLQYKIVPEVCSSIIPSDVWVTEKGFNLYVWTEYMKKAIVRLSEIGCKKVVWSNGRSRVLPEEGDISESKAQVRQFLHMLCGIAEKYDITVLIEPLSPRKTNFLNTMGEIGKFLPLIPENNLSSLISLRELEEIGFTTDKFSSYSDLISYVYVENPAQISGKRLAPTSVDAYDYSVFMSALKEINYEGIISLPEDADANTLKFLQSFL